MKKCALFSLLFLTTHTTHTALSTASLWGITNIVGGLIIAAQKPEHLKDPQDYRPYVLISVTSGLAGIATEKPGYLALTYPFLALGTMFFIAGLKGNNPKEPLDKKELLSKTTIEDLTALINKNFKTLTDKNTSLERHMQNHFSDDKTTRRQQIDNLSKLLQQLNRRSFTLSEQIDSLAEQKEPKDDIEKYQGVIDIQIEQAHELTLFMQAIGERHRTLETEISRLAGEIRALGHKAGDCSICMLPFQPRQLVCNHIFHTGCIDPWLAQHHTCPLCNRAHPDNPFVPRAFDPLAN